MSSFTCEYCGTDIIDTDAGYITGCEHYPIEKPVEHRHRRTSFLELLIEHQTHENPLTKSVTKQIIKNRVDAENYT